MSGIVLHPYLTQDACCCKMPANAGVLRGASGLLGRNRWRLNRSTRFGLSMPRPTTAIRPCTIRRLKATRTWWNCCWPTAPMSIAKTDLGGRTPLHEAAKEGHKDLAELLRQRGGHE